MRRILLALAMLVVLFGCPPMMPSSGPVTWPDGPPGYFKASWHQGMGPVNLGTPANLFLCGLSAVSGRFAGPGEWVLVNVDSTGNWVLSGASQQNSVWAEATCVSVDAFLQPNGMQWSTGSWTRSFHSHTTIPCFAPDDYCPVVDQATPLWGGDSVCYLTGFGGFHLGIGESAEAEQYYKYRDPTWYLDLQATDGLYPGVSPLHEGQYTWGGAACVEFFNLQASEPYVSPGMPEVFKGGPGRVANKNNAFCALSMAGGSFFGSGETVRISGIDVDGRQELSVSSSQGGTRASAVCIYYDQVNPPNPGIEPYQ
jgi:hypothetical protein